MKDTVKEAVQRTIGSTITLAVPLAGVCVCVCVCVCVSVSGGLREVHRVCR